MKKASLAILSLALVLCIGMAGMVSVQAVDAAISQDDVVAQNAYIPIQPFLTHMTDGGSSIHRNNNGTLTLSGNVSTRNSATITIQLFLEQRATIFNSWSTIVTVTPSTVTNRTTHGMQFTTANPPPMRGMFRTRAEFTVVVGNSTERHTAHSPIITI